MLLTIGTPYYETMKYEYNESLMDVMLNRPFDVQLIQQKGTYIHQQRNLIWHQTKGDYLLFIDADMRFTLKNIMDLIKLDKPIACGLYYNRHKEGKHPLIYDFTDEGWKGRGKVPQRPVQIDGTGCGFMLIKREVMEAYTPKLMVTMGPPFDHVAHFYPDRGPVQDSGEDLSFCYRMKQLGVPVWLHPGVVLGHVKSVVI